MKTETRTPRPNHGTMTCEFNRIEKPGLYLDLRTGALLRVPEDALTPGQSSEIRTTVKPRLVTRIHDDPYLATTRARMLAADLDFVTGSRPRTLPRREDASPPTKSTRRTPRRSTRKTRRARSH